MGEKNADSVVIDYTNVTQPIRVVRSDKMLTVMANGKEILKTRNACIVHEPGYKPIYFFPLVTLATASLKPHPRCQTVYINAWLIITSWVQETGK